MVKTSIKERGVTFKLFIIIGFHALSLNSFSQPFFSIKERYKNEYNKANLFCQSISGKIDSIAKKFDIKTETLLPIVFPECMRYSVYQDKFETWSLEFLYTSYGKEYSDFSIGKFQMKPSFAEKIEETIKNDSTSFYKYRFIYKHANSESDYLIRMARIYRLKTLDWQILYLCCYYKIAEKYFSTLNFTSERDKVSFYATAYNLGFWKSITEIEKWRNIKLFPSGKIDNFNNYSYGDIAGEYYTQINKNH